MPITADDFLTGIAVLALFVASVAVLVAVVRSRQRHRWAPVLAVAVAVAAIAWSALGLIFLLGSSSATVSADEQYVFLTLTSVLALMIPLSAVRTRRVLLRSDWDPRMSTRHRA